MSGSRRRRLEPGALLLARARRHLGGVLRRRLAALTQGRPIGFEVDGERLQAGDFS